MKDINLHVGYDPAATKARMLDAIRRAGGGSLAPQSHLTFESFEVFSRTLSGKRLELLRHVHARPAASIAALARALGRDYKRVHEDVEVLSAAGLLDRTDKGGVRAAYDEIRTVISLAPAA
jgi:predicted transcriptional regulator